MTPIEDLPLSRENEVWKLVPGWEQYKVSNCGSVVRLTDHGRNLTPPRPVKEQPPHGSYKYASVCLFRMRDGKRERYNAYTHKLVLLAFIGLCPKGLEGEHKDGNKKNNSVSNLEYVTRGENNRRAFAMGLRKPVPKEFMARGEKHYGAKLTDGKVRLMRYMRAEGTSYSKLARLFHIHTMTAWRAASGRGWSHIVGSQTS